MSCLQRACVSEMGRQTPHSFFHCAPLSNVPFPCPGSCRSVFEAIKSQEGKGKGQSEKGEEVSSVRDRALMIGLSWGVLQVMNICTCFDPKGTVHWAHKPIACCDRAGVPSWDETTRL